MPFSIDFGTQEDEAWTLKQGENTPAYQVTVGYVQQLCAEMPDAFWKFLLQKEM